LEEEIVVIIGGPSGKTAIIDGLISKDIAVIRDFAQ
jgi:hypothetical protein